MISCFFSTAVAGVFRSLLFHSVICSLGGSLSHGSPVVVFFDRGHPCFWNFYSTIPVDVVRVKSYMNKVVEQWVQTRLFWSDLSQILLYNSGH